jgi:glycosyltransferase involved in cell wall biosynthesis
MYRQLVIVTENISLPRDEGAKKATFELITSLADLSTPISVITATQEQLPNAALFIARKNKIIFIWDTLHYLKKIRPTLIIYIPASALTFLSFLRAVIMTLLCPASKVALVGLQPRNYPSFYRWLPFGKRIDAVFVHSSASMNALSKVGFSSYCLPLAVDLEKFNSVSQSQKEILRLKYGVPIDAKIALHVGHLNIRRNIDTLIPLAELGYFVIVVGSTSTSHDDELKQSLARPGVRVFSDYIENVEELYQLADCYVFPVKNSTSAIEIPLSVLEAMACNLPVVTTRFGGLPELFSEASGLYYLDDDEDLVSAINFAMQDSLINTRQMVAKYSWRSIASQLLNIVG